MGRDRKSEHRVEHWTKVIRNTMETPAWRSLSCTAQALYPWLKLEWRGPDANNNGKIRLSVRQAADRLGVRPNTASYAFQELQAKGFLHVTEIARLGLGGSAKGTTYEITELATPGNQSGRKLYLNWQEGADYPVVKAASQGNCRGSQKTKPCIENQDGTVLKIDTFRKEAYRK